MRGARPLLQAAETCFPVVLAIPVLFVGSLLAGDPAAAAIRAALTAAPAVWVTLTVGAAAGAVASRGLAAWVLRSGSHRRMPRFVALSVLVAPLAWIWVTDLTSGASISRHPSVGALRVVATGAAAFVTARTLILWRTWWFGHRPGASTRLLRVAAGVGLLAAGTLVNVVVLRRQYLGAHLAVATGAVGGALLLMRTLPWAPGPRVAAAALVALAAAAWSVPAPATLESGWSPAARITTALEVVRDDLFPPPPAPADPRALENLTSRVESGRRDALLARRGGKPPRHVVMITIDTLRARNIGHLGYDRPTTPELDRFAAKAVTFERAYAQASHSLPSIMSVFTGRYPAALNDTRRQHGARTTVVEHTLAEALATEGFRTVAFPAFHAEELTSAFGSFSRGFQEYNAVRGGRRPSAAEVVDRGLARWRDAGDARLFLWLHFMEVHGPYGGIEPVFGRSELDRYDAAIALVDRELGRLFREATTGGLLDDALVVVHSDHGEEFREHGGRYHGGTVYEEVIHVPMLMTLPGLSPRRVTRCVELVDIVPTVLDILGLTPPSPVHGDSLVPLLLGDDMPSVAVAQAFSRSRFVPDRLAVVDGRWKIIGDVHGPKHFFFDLENDAGEQTPITDGVDGPTARRLRSLLAAARAVTPAVPGGRAVTTSAVEAVLDLDDRDAVRDLLRDPADVRHRRALDVALADPEAWRAELSTYIRGVAAVPPKPRREQTLAHALGARELRAFKPDVVHLLETLEDARRLELWLDVFADLGGPGDAGWLQGWATRHGGAMTVRAAVIAAGWGVPGAVAIARRVLEGADATAFWWGLAHLASRGDTVARAEVVAAALAPDMPSFVTMFSLGALWDVGDPATFPLARRAQRARELLPPGFNTLALQMLERDRNRPPAADPVIAAIYRSGTPAERVRALALLARDGAAGPTLDRLHTLPAASAPPALTDSGRSTSWPAGPGRPAFLALGATTQSSTAGTWDVTVSRRRGESEVRVPGGLLAEATGHAIVGAVVDVVTGDVVTVHADDRVLGVVRF